MTEVLGDEEIAGLRLRDTRTGEESALDVGGFFVAIGHTPNTAFLEGQIDLKDNGYVRLPTSWRTETNVPGVFAAGDVMDDFLPPSGVGRRHGVHGGAGSGEVPGARIAAAPAKPRRSRGDMASRACEDQRDRCVRKSRPPSHTITSPVTNGARAR